MHASAQRASDPPAPTDARRSSVAPATAPAPVTAIAPPATPPVPPERPHARADPLAGLLARAVAARTLARKEIENGTATFKIDPYRMHLPEEDGKDTRRQVGVDVGVEYVPADTLRSDKIAFVQTIKATKGGAAYLFENMKPRATDQASGAPGWAVDRVAGRKSPIYGQNDDGAASATITFGFSKQSGSGGQPSTSRQSAKMHDYVKLSRVAGQTVTCDAVSWALDETNRTYLGGVSWGFSTDKSGTTTLKDPALEAAGAPTGVHKAALAKWNEQADLADQSKRNSPDQAKVVEP